MKHLRYAGAVIAALPEVLRPAIFIGADLLSAAGIAGGLGSIRIVSEHEGRARGTAYRGLTIGAFKKGSLSGEPIYVRRFADCVSITTQRCCCEIIRNDEQYVIWFLLRLGVRRKTNADGQSDA